MSPAAKNSHVRLCHIRIAKSTHLNHYYYHTNNSSTSFHGLSTISLLPIHAMFTNRVFRLFSVASTNLTRIQITYQTIFHKRSLRNIFDSSSAQFTTITNANDTNLGRIQFNQTANGNVGIRFYCDTHRKEIKFKMTKGKELIKDAIETKRINLREKKEVFVKDLREKRSRVQEKVKEMEEIVERENILTIPNLLCVGRGILAPIVGYIIVQEQYVLAIGLLAVAGLTDLVNR